MKQMMSNPDSEPESDSETPVANLLNALRGYPFVDTTDARFRERDDGTIRGTLPYSGSGDAGRKLRELARKNGWVHDPEGPRDYSEVTLLYDPDADPARDSTIQLSTRMGAKADRRRRGIPDLQPGDRCEVTVTDRSTMTHEDVAGTAVTPDELEEGDEIHLVWGDRRQFGGYSYSASSTEFHGEVADVTDEYVETEGGNRFANTDELPAPFLNDDMEGRDARHIIRLETNR